MKDNGTKIAKLDKVRLLESHTIELFGAGQFYPIYSVW